MKSLVVLALMLSLSGCATVGTGAEEVVPYCINPGMTIDSSGEDNASFYTITKQAHDDLDRWAYELHLPRCPHTSRGGWWVSVEVDQDGEWQRVGVVGWSSDNNVPEPRRDHIVLVIRPLTPPGTNLIQALNYMWRYTSAHKQQK